MFQFPDVIERLRARLQEPLPGMEAQKMMAPLISDPARFDQSSKANARPGAVMLLLYPEDNGEFSIPFMRRTEYRGAHSGQISLPGGKYEKIDQDLMQTALRESNEEMGISPEKVSLVGKLTDLFVTVSNFNIEPYIFYTSERPDFVPEETEVAEIIESRLSHLADPATVKETTINISSSFSLRTPYYDLNGQVLWGATAMIMSEFLTIYRQL